MVFFVLLPINAPLEYWGDSVQAALFVAFSLRYLILLNVVWLINSAHLVWGLDKRYKPSDSNMIFLVTKSYWPQYHYLLPFDYQTGEFGDYGKCMKLWGWRNIRRKEFLKLIDMNLCKTTTAENPFRFELQTMHVHLTFVLRSAVDVAVVIVPITWISL